MQESMEERIAQAEAQLRATQATAARIEQQLSGAVETVVSRDRSVEVTVGAQGNLTGLTFLDGKYRTMKATELASTVVETAEKARERMARRVMEAFTPLTTGGAGGPALEGFDATLEKLLGTSGGRPSAGGRKSAPLHDEIDED